MYNLIMTSKPLAWEGDPYVLEVERCVREREYTEQHLVERYGALAEGDLEDLLELPCIFAYEARGYREAGEAAPKFGFLRSVTREGDDFRFTYETRPLQNFLSARQFFDHREDFGIESKSFEMTRTHWAVKEVDLPLVLRRLSIAVPSSRTPLVDITKHVFDVALSFPGEAREIVEPIATELVSSLGRNGVSYDNNFESQLARPNLDTLLQGIYHHRAKLVVVFLSGHYQKKEWCGVEFRAVKEIIKAREDCVMFVRTDDGSVEGVFNTDGYVDARKRKPETIAKYIRERLELLR